MFTAHKHRVLFYHPESDCLFEEIDPEAISQVYTGMEIGSLVEDVTGQTWAEYRWAIEN